MIMDMLAANNCILARAFASYLVSAIVFVGGICSVPSCVAPIPESESTLKAYFPASKGTKWVYQIGSAEEEYVISSSKKQGSDTLLIISKYTPDGKYEEYEHLLLNSRHLSSIPFGNFKVKRDVILLKLPPKSGEEWGFETSSNGIFPARVGTMMNTGQEDIQTPAGPYRATKVTARIEVMRGTILLKPVEEHSWYSPGIGLIKNTDYNGNIKILKRFATG